MKSIKLTLAAVALSSIAFGSMAADLVNKAPMNQQQIGVVSASGSTNLTSLENQLAEKANAAGAKSFRITSTSGNNKLNGTAVIYN
ncbi:multiple stress resistance protein BhsA [Candidatus Pantoea symbiotica]|uniref:Multiple stress resistance protein BhsA n=1 Tax=Candidatus Pantoea symbiotica TaxID=1884370 RepID=A0A1I3TY73_9GAMM|nr:MULTISPECIES: YdgH/BhsA/McbA-like domain containing protein [Pantoea]SFJ74477.1 multiple stress resistance protein BhsA [Pantoea symbiotica]SFU46518.1 multiple stress resistance protein BhsA [Pantoea sp. YR525]